MANNNTKKKTNGKNNGKGNNKNTIKSTTTKRIKIISFCLEFSEKDFFFSSFFTVSTFLAIFFSS